MNNSTALNSIAFTKKQNATFHLVKLCDVVSSEKNSIVDGPFGSSLKTSDYVVDGIPVLQGKNITGNKFKFTDIRFISLQKSKELIRSKVVVGDILVIKIGSIGYAAEIDDLGGYPYAIIPANLAKITIDTNRIVKNYLLQWLKTDSVKKYFESVASKTAQPALSLGKIKDLPVPLPPLAEQQRIATLLDTADRILKQRESAIAKLDQLASTTFDEMYDALDAVSTKSLGEILELQRGASPRPIADWMTESEDGVNWIKIADATASDKYIYKCKERIKKEAVAMTRYVKSGDFLLSNSMSFGRPYILKTDGCIHDGWLLIRDTKNVFEQDFLYAVLSCKTVKEQFKKLATGAVVKNLNIDAVSKVKVKIPEKNIQKVFSNKMHELEANKAAHVKQLSTIKALLFSLQHQSFAVN